MKKIRAAVVGYGNIGKYALQALEAAPDFEVAGIVRRNGAADKPQELAQYDVVKDIRELKDVDVAILATPTRSCEEYARQILPLGINTVDSFDIHTSILDYRAALTPINKETKTVSVIAAGWDPGSDSIVRTLMQSLAPKGLSYTNFGPGMSMGHSVCVRSKAGVKNALSMTIPLGEGIHRRMVYVEPSRPTPTSPTTRHTCSRWSRSTTSATWVTAYIWCARVSAVRRRTSAWSST